MDHPRHAFVHGRHRRRGGRRAARRAVGHRRALRRRDARRSLDHGTPANSSRPTSTARSCCSRRRAQTPALRRFVQISTDEVYGSVRERRRAARPTSSGRAIPYSASKAGADRLAYSYWATYRRAGRSSPARRTTTGRTSFPRRSSRSSSPTPIDDIPVPLYGDGRTSATGCTSPITAAPSIC